jgi:hypothetical protein
MKFQLKPVVLFLCCAALLLSGCKDKKKQSTVPPQAQAPTVTPPAVTPPTATGQPTTADEDQPKSPATTSKRPKKPAANTKPTPKPANDKDKDKPVEVAANTPPKIIIQEGGTASPPATTSPLTEHTEAAHNRATTDQLLDSTEANLRSVKRQLSGDEQATVTQIRDFMTQSRQAIKDKDQVRARNLAMKAHLLSDELVKPR